MSISISILQQALVFAFAVSVGFLSFIILIIVCHKIQQKKKSRLPEQIPVDEDPPPSYGDVGTLNSAYTPDLRLYDINESNSQNERAVDCPSDGNKIESNNSDDGNCKLTATLADCAKESELDNEVSVNNDHGSIPSISKDCDLKIKDEDKEKGESKVDNTESKDEEKVTPIAQDADGAESIQPEEGEQGNNTKDTANTEPETSTEDKKGSTEEEPVVESVTTKLSNWWKNF